MNVVKPIPQLKLNISQDCVCNNCRCDVLLVAIVDSSPVTCGMEQAERCLDPFHEHLENGVTVLASLDDQNLAVVCR